VTMARTDTPHDYLARELARRLQALPTVEAVPQGACAVDDGVVQHVHALLGNLDALLVQEGFDPATSWPVG